MGSQERDGGWRCGRVGSVPLYVTPSALVLVGVLTILFAPVVQWLLPGVGAWGYLVALSLPAVLMLSVLAHEVGHLLAGRAIGLPATHITLDLLGGATDFEGDARTPGREALLAASGPGVSLLLAGVGVTLTNALSLTGLAGVLASDFTALNLVVAGFNLLPGLPLDGGQILRACVWKLSGRPELATRVAGWAGRVLAVGVIAVPIVRLATGTRVGILVIGVFVLAGATMWSGASQALREPRRELAAAGQLCRRALPVPGHVLTADALAAAQEHNVRALVIVDDAQRPVAVVSEAAVAAISPEHRSTVAIGALARTLEPDLVLSAELAGPDLAAHLRRSDGSEYLLLDILGRLVGVLSRHDLGPEFRSPGQPSHR